MKRVSGLRVERLISEGADISILASSFELYLLISLSNQLGLGDEPPHPKLHRQHLIEERAMLWLFAAAGIAVNRAH